VSLPLAHGGQPLAGVRNPVTSVAGLCRDRHRVAFGAIRCRDRSSTGTPGPPSDDQAIPPAKTTVWSARVVGVPVLRTLSRYLGPMDVFDLELIAEWLEMAGMVNAVSAKLEADVSRLLHNWMTIDDLDLRQQGLREMERILEEALAAIRVQTN
jgi:hypothetical protein